MTRNSKNESKPSSYLDKFNEKIQNPGKPKARLPRLGCIWIFGLFLLLAGSLATGFYHSAGEVPTSFDIPEGRVTVSDSAGILLEEDQIALEALAADISKQAACSVAVMFIDGRFADMLKVFNEIAADWEPEKGVLLLCDGRNNSMRFGLLGTGWQIADWDDQAVRKECLSYRNTQRGAEAIALLTRLKHSLEAAAKAGEAEEKTSEPDSAAAETSRPARRNTAAMTEEQIEAEVAAQEKAEEARIAAEDKAAEEALDEDFDDEESVGMRAYAEKNGRRKESGILYSTAVARGDENTVRIYSLVFLALTVLVAVIALKNGYATRKRDLKNNPKVIQEFKKKHADNSSLRLVDLNEYLPDNWLHKNFLKVTAIVLGVFIALGFVSSTLSEPLVKDVPRHPSSLIPDYPENGKIVDQAKVFSQEGRAKVAAAIDRLETRTGGEMMVFTVPTTNGVAIEDFSMDAAMKWKIGKKGKDNGALFVLAVDDRRNRIEIGYGWEGAVNDARAGDLLRDIVPELRDEQYAEATVKVVRGIERFVAGTPDGDEEAGPDAAPAKPKVHVPDVRSYGTLTYAKPKHDPRILNPADSAWGLLGVFGCLIAVLLAYWGRIVGTSAPHLDIYDPTAVRSYSSSGDSGGSSSSYSSSSSSSSHSGGGGSFGGGGASGRW